MNAESIRGIEAVSYVLEVWSRPIEKLFGGLVNLVASGKRLHNELENQHDNG